MQGYIRLFRKLVDWEWYGDPVVKSVFIDLLIHANFKEKKWQGQIVKPGELVTSVSSIADRNGLSIQQVRTALAKLEKTGEINKRSTNKNTLIIVLNYKRYQEFDDSDISTFNKQSTNLQQSNNKQSTTTNNDNNVKNVNKYTTTAIREKLAEKYSQEDLTQEWIGTGLTIAEYCYLSEHINVNVLDKYILKVNNYENCQDKFGTILRWSMLDEYYHD